MQYLLQTFKYLPKVREFLRKTVLTNIIKFKSKLCKNNKIPIYSSKLKKLIKRVLYKHMVVQL